MKLHDYVYVDHDSEWGDRFVRIELFDVWPNLKRWLLSKRPRVLQEAEAYVRRVDRFVAQQQRKAHIEELRAKGAPSFNELMEVMLYDAERAMARDLERQLFGSRSFIELAKSRPANSTADSWKGQHVTFSVVDEVADAPEFGLVGETVGHEFDDAEADFERRYDHRYEEWHDMGGDA